MANHSIHEAVTAARAQVENFLSGEGSLANAADALQVLRKHDGTYLERLQTVMSGDKDLKKVRICALMRGALDEYLSLGPGQRAESMPEVFQHLIDCEECSKQFSNLEHATSEINDEWIGFRENLLNAAIRIPSFERLTMWILSKTAGLWQSSEVGKKLGDWTIGELKPAGVRLSKPLETRSLRMALPQSLGTLIAWITPSTIGDWEIEFVVSEQSPMHKCTIGLGDAQGPILGTRILPEKGSVRFAVDIPAREPYWIHLEWTLGQGQPWQNHKVALPIISEE